MFLVGVRRLKEHREKRNVFLGLKGMPGGFKTQGKASLCLTGAQERTLKEVFSDMAGGRVMNRLIQGDVGSGKTIIAILALLQAAYKRLPGSSYGTYGVLARQHFETISGMLEEYSIPLKQNFSPAL